MKQLWRILFGDDVQLEKKIYYVFSAMFTLNFAVLYSFNVIVGMGDAAATVSAFAIILTVIVNVLSYISENYMKWAFLNILALDLIVLPTAFFAFGGTASGMLSYLVLGIFITSAILRGRQRLIALVLSFAADAVILSLNFIHPEFVAVKSPFHHFVSELFCLTVGGIFIIIGSVAIISQFTRQKIKYEALLKDLERLSNEEPLTHLHNRRYLIGKAEAELENRNDVCAVMIDIDNFKKYNDLYGHQFGDEILTEIASLIADIFGYENVCRYGGEEFLAIIAGKDISEVTKSAEELRERLKAIDHGKANSQVTVSVGIAHKGTRTVYETISAADEMLYAAKNKGKNTIERTNA